MDTNDRYTSLCDDLNRLMLAIDYSVPVMPEELMTVVAYDVAAMRAWFPTEKAGIEAVSDVLTSLDRRVFLVNDGNQNAKHFLDPMYTREIRPLYRFSETLLETGTIWKRTLRTGKASDTAMARQWLADVSAFVDELNAELDNLESKLPADIAEGMDREVWKEPSEEMKRKIAGTIRVLG